MDDDFYVDIAVDLDHFTYTLQFREGALAYDEITLPVGDLVADLVVVTWKGRPVMIAKVPDELYEKLADYLQAKGEGRRISA